MPSLTKHLRKLSNGLSVKLPGQKDAANDTPKTTAAMSTGIAGRAGGSTQRVQFRDEPPPPYSRVERRDDQHDVTTLSDDDCAEFEPQSPVTPTLTLDGPVFRDTLTGAFEAYGSSTVPHHRLTMSQEMSDADKSGNIDEPLDETNPQQSTAAIDDRPFTPSVFSTLPREIWLFIGEYLRPQDSASLAFVNRETAQRLGPFFWPPLRSPSNHTAKAAFLAPLESKLPNHVLCKPCALFHARHGDAERRDREVLRSAYEYIRKPLLASHCKSRPSLPSTRLTADCVLHFHLAKLAMFAEHIPNATQTPLTNLNRTWTPDNSVWADISSSWTVDTTWKHRARFAIAGPSQPGKSSQLLMKVTSTYYPRANLTASEQRLVLSCRKDYSANYTTCSHEAKGGLLFSACKCALGHIPDPRNAGLASQCHRCRPLYKCVLCPSEYMVQIKLLSHGTQFRHALVVTRWTNLGECKTYDDPEWAACSSEWDYQDEESAIWRSEDKTARRLWTEATGEAHGAFKAVPLRRPSHWRSESRGDEVFDLGDL